MAQETYLVKKQGMPKFPGRQVQDTKDSSCSRLQSAFTYLFSITYKGYMWLHSVSFYGTRKIIQPSNLLFEATQY